MKKLLAIGIALTFAACALTPAAWAQAPAPATKAAPPAKAEAKPAPTPAAPAPAKAESKPAPAPAAPRKAAEKKDSDKLDLNTASAADLKGAGFSDAEAKKIVDGRPYKRKDELVQKKIITKEQYEKVKENIIARQPKKEEAKKK